MELDTGSATTILPRQVFEERFSSVRLDESKTVLKTYSGERVPLCGETNVNVEYKGNKLVLPLIVADVKGKTPILGRDWISQLDLNLGELFKKNVNLIKNVDASITRENDLKNLLKKHEKLFENRLGLIKDIEAKIVLKPDVQPKFMKARPVPYALRQKVEEELDKLEIEDVISKVASSEWATPVVVVPKKSSEVRLCGDYKVTLNPCIEVDKYPLPKPADLFATLSGSTIFSKIDLTKAFHQLKVTEETKKLLAINTHKGLYAYNRLPFGIASCPSIFQETMERILQGLPCTVTFQDDIEVGGTDSEEHLKILDLVLTRLGDYGIEIKAEKCQFMKENVEYLGHIIDKEGLHTIPEKVAAIVDAPVPTNTSQLRSFLGMMQYYGKFIPNMSTTLHPLNNLLKSNVKWNWNRDCQEAFNKAKKALVSADVLTHYDLKLPLKLACDASNYGLGAVISHILPDGTEKPIAYASRTLEKSEQNYAQIEKEALALVYGVKKFHEYLYGRHFTLITDHKPLLALLGPHKAVSTLAAARMQRWALILAAYTYNIEYKKSEDHFNADLLSRLHFRILREQKKVKFSTFHKSMIFL